MPHLFQINVVVNQGSTGKIVEQLGQMVLDKGWKSTIAYGRWPRESKSDLYRIGSDWDMRVHALKSRIFDNSGLNSAKATIKLIERIRLADPDIIHLHNIHGYYLHYRILFDFLKQYNKPVVWTLHDCWPFTGHCAYFDYPKCDKWRDGCGHCECLTKYPSSWCYDRSGQNYEDKKSAFLGVKNLTLVPVSAWLTNLLKQSFLKDCPMLSIRNGIDLNNFSVKGKTNDGKFRILAVSNVWEERKGLPDIMKLRSELPSDFEITVVGVSQKQMQTLPRGINGITRTENQKQLADLYAESNVLINTTYEDNYPTVNLEALACGTPVVTYRTGGSPEAIDEKTGIVVPQGDVKALAEAIVSMKYKPLLSEDCRKRAKLYFDKNICFKSYVNLYEELIR